MQTLARSIGRTAGIGEPLPVVFPAMERKGWNIRRAQVTMIAAAPNVGKSALALFLAVTWKLPTLYISADTDPFTTVLRAAAMLTQTPIPVVERNLLHGGEGFYEQELGSLKDVRFCFDSAPTLEDIDLEVSAFNEVYGDVPAVIIIDNLMNVQCDDADEFRSLRIVVTALHQLARTTGAAVLALHHVTGEWEDGQVPPPRRALHGKISKLPELILTLGKNQQEFGIAAVKNRNGGADPLAQNAVWVPCDLERMVFVTDDRASGS